MKKINNKHGFTLIEMLVVIAIIAVLVAIIVPVVSTATTKARAATDAANLRGVLGSATTLVLTNGTDASILASDASNDIEVPECKSFSGAKVYIMCADNDFFNVFYVANGTDYYSLAYFSEVAETGSSDKVTDEAGASSGHSNVSWYSIPYVAVAPVEDVTE